MQGFVRRIAVPALLLACVGIEWSRGGDSLPTWMANVSIKTGMGTDRALRILIALELCGAVLACLSARNSRPVAWAAGVGFAFSALAELSAIVNAPGTNAVAASVWVAPLAWLALGAGILAVMSRPGPAPAPWRFSAWRLMGGIVVCAIGFGIAGRLDLAARTNARIGDNGVETVVLNPSEWVGMTLPQTGLSRQVPALTPLTLEGTKWIVLYSPTCARCHEVFRVYFAGPQNGEVIAVAIPHAPGEEVLKSDQPEDVACEGCERLTLPEGKRWIVTPPTIIKVEGGKITCVTSADYDRCRKGSESAP